MEWKKQCEFTRGSLLEMVSGAMPAGTSTEVAHYPIIPSFQCSQNLLICNSTYVSHNR
jgi:hypothetical protein